MESIATELGLRLLGIWQQPIEDENLRDLVAVPVGAMLRAWHRPTRLVDPCFAVPLRPGATSGPTAWSWSQHWVPGLYLGLAVVNLETCACLPHRDAAQRRRELTLGVRHLRSLRAGLGVNLVASIRYNRDFLGIDGNVHAAVEMTVVARTEADSSQWNLDRACRRVSPDRLTSADFPSAPINISVGGRSTPDERDLQSPGECQMNVLHVTKDFSGTGAQRVSLTILKGIDAERRFYCADRGDSYNTRFVDALRDGAIVPLFISGLSNRRFFNLPFAILRLAGFIRRERIDLIHSHSLLAGIAARIAATLTRTPCIHTFHGAPSRKYRRFAFALCVTVERLLAPLTRFVVFNAEYQRRLIGLAPPRARVIYNYVLPGRPHATARTPGTLPKVLFLGRFEFQKNPLFFVELAAAIGAGRARFRMVGGGTLADAVHAANRERGAGVEVLEFADDPSPHLDWADCLVLCSRYESFPLVIGEALSAGCAVVCSRVDGLDELWGDAVRFYEEGSLEDAVRTVGEALRARGAHAGVGALERFGIERFHHAHRSLYAEALGDRVATKAGLE